MSDAGRPTAQAPDPAASQDATGGARPLLRVVSGDPSPEELAALLAVVTARTSTSSATAEPSTPPSRWTARGTLLRRPLHPGPGAWRASGLPGH